MILTLLGITILFNNFYYNLFLFYHLLLINITFELEKQLYEILSVFCFILSLKILMFIWSRYPSVHSINLTCCYILREKMHNMLSVFLALCSENVLSLKKHFASQPNLFLIFFLI